MLIRLGIITSPVTADQYRQVDPALTGHGPNGHGETKAIDPRIADEVRAINAVFDSETKALDADRKSLATKSTVVPERSDPIQTASFDC